MQGHVSSERPPPAAAAAAWPEKAKKRQQAADYNDESETAPLSIGKEYFISPIH
jgi:hypothetical protein